jgi:hypothetical protein
MLTLGFDKIKEYYDKGLWNKGQVWDAVSRNKITEAQYTEITGDAYPTERPI